MFNDSKNTVYLQRIAEALEIIALHFSAEDGRMWHPKLKAVKEEDDDEKSELLHTDDAEQLVYRLRDELEFGGKGFTE